MLKIALTSALLGAAATAALLIEPPSLPTPADSAGIVFVGRTDLGVEFYQPLAKQLQASLTPAVAAWVYVADPTNPQNTIQENYQKYAAVYNSTGVVVVGHSMSNGGVIAQSLGRTGDKLIKGVVFLAAFLQRNQRPDIRTCLTKAAIQPQRSFKYPLKFLKDGAHDCYGPNIPDFPLPSLTIGGELDGVVRVSRIAEAFYTQIGLARDAERSPVVVVKGLNHAQLIQAGEVVLAALPDAILSKDLKSESQTAVSEVVGLFSEFALTAFGKAPTIQVLNNAVAKTVEFLKPLIEAFVEKEGSWFFTGADDEHGSSRWTADAQRLMAEPLPNPYSWETANEFRLLADEEIIPPYYRPKHRPQVTLTGTRSLKTSTVTQLRFIKVSVTEAAVGLNADAIVKEEKLNVLTAVPDDGDAGVAAIEMATKLASRQLVYNVSQLEAPDSLDDGDRCKAINQVAYEWALSKASPDAVKRFNTYGLPLRMVEDQAAVPSAGPFFIWNYLKLDKKADALEVAAFKAFFSTSANPYGAGNHYCKLLSPAWVMEWIYTDGLRDKYGVKA